MFGATVKAKAKRTGELEEIAANMEAKMAEREQKASAKLKHMSELRQKVAPKLEARLRRCEIVPTVHLQRRRGKHDLAYVRL